PGSLLGPATASAKYHRVRYIQHSSDFPDPGTLMSPSANDGKEGVAGSSPAEGFIGTPRYGGGFLFPRQFSPPPPPRRFVGSNPSPSAAGGLRQPATVNGSRLTSTGSPRALSVVSTIW